MIIQWGNDLEAHVRTDPAYPDSIYICDSGDTILVFRSELEDLIEALEKVRTYYAWEEGHEYP